MRNILDSYPHDLSISFLCVYPIEQEVMILCPCFYITVKGLADNEGKGNTGCVLYGDDDTPFNDEGDVPIEAGSL